MRTIKSYNVFNEDKKVADIINYLDYSINESVDIKELWNSAIDKIRNLSDVSKKKILNHIVASLLVFNSVTAVTNMIKKSDAEGRLKEIALSFVEPKVDKEEKLEEEKWKKGYEFTLSQKGWDHIKEEETLRLKAYSIGDGMISIGWGHAEPKNNSSFTIGQDITEKEADELLKMDMNTVADGVRRIFTDWEKEGVDIKITQDMFDALVSIAYNTGVGGLRRSELIKDIKKGDYDSAGEKIKTFRVSKKFPGLANRREKESEMFLASL